MQKRRRRKIGDVYAIPLPSGKFAFGRTFADGDIGIYEHIGNNLTDLPSKENYQFIVGVYEDVLKSGNWLFVENRPFASEEDAWPPPAFICDSLSGEFSLYHKGVITPSTKKQCWGLERAAVWDAEHVVDRIMGIDKWHKDDIDLWDEKGSRPV